MAKKLKEVKEVFIKNKSDRKFDKLLIITFFVGILLISATYAWFASSLNARVNFVDMKINTEGGLYISFDGINFSSNVQLNKETIITALKETYPTHTNQWAGRGLYAVSSNGIPNSATPFFDFYGNSKVSNYFDDGFDIRIINSHKLGEENKIEETSFYLAFDIFLKNISNSPMPDNLYLGEQTKVEISEGDEEDGTVNSIRIGMSKVGTSNKNATPDEIQNVTCNNACESVIYEPNAFNHSEKSIERLEKYGISLFNGRAANTFAIVSEGKNLSILNGHIGTGIPLDLQHFQVQKNVTTIVNPIFKLPSGITKFRVYIWVEGQDLDSLETISEGTTINIDINLKKDIAGYEYYD